MVAHPINQVCLIQRGGTGLEPESEDVDGEEFIAELIGGLEPRA
jgi:hypothetical protein